jgi:predicted amidophosphoribosyltransferase
LKMSRLSIPLVCTNASAGVINPERCPECGRPWKRASAADKSTECPECREYLDEEKDACEKRRY